ncbi:hypothetical protein PoB_002326300 [Plakobranchus ocellatus]|uniref:Uncharacterized protein n=1 Tax=Plakobranchus ocellatus TaxID=259542 RepID=A0AAV3ZQK5_9GAST|nr:hypothetical protein PoB_002326300 [Plakobranchus ocellatus]
MSSPLWTADFSPLIEKASSYAWRNLDLTSLAVCFAMSTAKPASLRYVATASITESPKHVPVTPRCLYLRPTQTIHFTVHSRPFRNMTLAMTSVLNNL